MEKDKKKKKSKAWIWFLLIILILLILLTNIILVVRMGNYAPIEKNTIFLVTKKPGITISDDEIQWENNSDLKIFSSEFINQDNQLIVQNEEKRNIIAPGVEDTYSFKLKNTGNMAVDYNVDINSKFILGSKTLIKEQPPIIVRIKNDNAYCLGSEKKWASINELNDFIGKGTLGVNNYTEYTIEWKWDYENSDIVDTSFGILSANTSEPLEFSIKINTLATANNNPKITGGIKDTEEVEVKEIGGTIKIFPFTILIILIIILVILLIVRIIKEKKEELERDEDNDKENN